MDNNMYDRVKIWLPMNNSVNALSPYLSNIILYDKLSTNERVIYGYNKNMKVSCFENGCSICGSLARYIYPNNIYPLDIKKTKEVLMMLSDSLHIKIENAYVYGLEFGTQFIMRKEVIIYLNKLGSIPRLLRIQFNDDTLYYKSNAKKNGVILCFYDKNKEAKKNGFVLPDGFERLNMLKYEMRLNGKLSRMLKKDVVKVSLLYDIVTYREILKKWQDYYFSIKKQSQNKYIGMNYIRTVDDAYNFYVARKIFNDGILEIDDFIKELKVAEVFNNRSDYYRLRNKFSKVEDKFIIIDSDEDIIELDDAIKNAGAYV